jgi:hypothetical protein
MPRSPNCKVQPQTRKVDWEAIERDYRTGRLTLRELESKHGRSASQICRRAQAEGWTQDLRHLVRQATSAAIMRDLAAEATTSAQQSTTQTVLAAAEVMKQVIFKHRHEAAAARTLTASLMSELEAATKRSGALLALLDRAGATMDEAEASALAAQAREFVKLHARVASMQKLADTMTRLHTLERKAFGIAEDDVGTNPLDTMQEHELEAEILRLQAKLACPA